ncbi:9347_t:CDS:2 [Entrophospora sp. SA101]|nr:9347_t:CDS:2 [Entrophospora sp. SA101]
MDKTDYFNFSEESTISKLSEIYEIDQSTIINVLERNSDLLDDLNNSFTNITKTLDGINFEEIIELPPPSPLITIISSSNSNDNSEEKR